MLYRLESVYLISAFDDTKRIAEHMGYLFAISHEQFGLAHRTTLATALELGIILFQTESHDGSIGILDKTAKA